jgi:thiol-disulfide isomerase/thioredoxin
MKKYIITSAYCIFFCVLTAMGQGRGLTPASPEEISKAKAAVIAQPENEEAHKAYIKAAGGARPEVLKQYDAWIKKYPKSAIIPAAIGERLANQESPKAKTYLLEAIRRDPKLASAWGNLSSDAERWGEFDKSTEYLAKATAAAPDDPNYAFYYAMKFDDTDPAKYEALCLEFIKRFPESQRAAQALYWLAYRLQDPAKKMKYAEMMSKEFPPEKYNWSKSGMDYYYELLFPKEIDKALQLAERMKTLPDAEETSQAEWTRRQLVAQRFKEAKALQAEPDKALALLAGLNTRRDAVAAEEIALLKASLEASAGRTQQAYDSLLKFQSSKPSDKISKTLSTYAARLGKNEAAVQHDLRTLLDQKAKQATPFTLDAYFTKNKISLSDYKGKVILLTYWFPGCGPCRGEFPHFENVLKKFKGKDVVYLGINIVREQDPYVIPFLKSSGYTFTPLAEDAKRDKGNLPSPGAPTNYLIDQEGRIIYSNFMIHGDTERMLELMIESMLRKKTS